MAAGRLKSLRLPPDKTVDHCDYEETRVNFPKMATSKSIDIISHRSFSIFDGFLITFSLVTYLVDIITDAMVSVQYLQDGHVVWGSLTITFILVPAIVMQVFSARWYLADNNMSILDWILHILLLAPLQRYILVLKAGIDARKSNDAEDYEVLFHNQNDVFILRLFESFLESAPQLLLQLYVMAYTKDANLLTGFSAGLSLLSLGWAIAAYTKAMRQAHQEDYKPSWGSMLLQTCWRMGTVAARVLTLVVFASVYREYLFLVLGLHWIFMTIWIFIQRTDFCTTWWEERLFNAVVGVIYCFCFFNLKEGRTRWRMLIFYTIMLLENGVLLGLWYPYRWQGAWYNDAVLAAVCTSTLIGLVCMGLYYRFCHPSGPLYLCGERGDATMPSPIHKRHSKETSPFSSPVRNNKRSGLLKGQSSRASMTQRFSEVDPYSPENITVLLQDTEQYYSDQERNYQEKLGCYGESETNEDLHEDDCDPTLNSFLSDFKTRTRFDFQDPMDIEHAEEDEDEEEDEEHFMMNSHYDNFDHLHYPPHQDHGKLKSPTQFDFLEETYDPTEDVCDDDEIDLRDKYPWRRSLVSMSDSHIRYSDVDTMSAPATSQEELDTEVATTEDDDDGGELDHDDSTLLQSVPVLRALDLILNTYSNETDNEARQYQDSDSSANLSTSMCSETQSDKTCNSLDSSVEKQRSRSTSRTNTEASPKYILPSSPRKSDNIDCEPEKAVDFRSLRKQKSTGKMRSLKPERKSLRTIKKNHVRKKISLFHGEEDKENCTF